jgi:bifunctional UDP-N-acetylglucosamine pyrophosphorylase/glucosamine-1-phosphate N-acetyltransferase
MVAKKDFCVLVLAGGKGTRMKSNLPKPLHKICGAPILVHILKTARCLRPAAIGIITGHRAELLKETVQNNLQKWDIKTPVDFILQKELTGSGTAVKYGVAFIKKFSNVIILAGDAPLIKAATLKKLLQKHFVSKAACTVLSVDIEIPKGYGRIIRNCAGGFEEIVEEGQTNPQTAAIKEVNSGMYIFDVKFLINALPSLKPQGPKQEYYLTDVLALLRQKDLKVEVFKADNYEEAMGINSQKQLAAAAEIMRRDINDKLMDGGVAIINPNSVYIDAGVKISAGSLIYPNVFISGKTIVGAGCVIGPGCWIENSVISGGTILKAGCYITEAKIGKNCQIGPYAHLRPASVLKDGAKVGNFVEIKKSVIGAGSKVPHLSYIGDSDIGVKVNIGAGSITCNYDGVNKHRTKIKDGVFVGSNTNFVAPVTVGKNAKIGAGSTITQDIPPAALAIARARQVNKPKRK